MRKLALLALVVAPVVAPVVACKSTPSGGPVVVGPDPLQAKPIDAAPAPVAEEPVKPMKPPPDVAFTAQCESSLAAATAQRAAVLGVKDARTIENTLEPLNELGRQLGNALAPAGLLQNVHPDAKLRDAARGCEQKSQALISELYTDKALYAAVAAVDVKAADAPTKRFATVTLRDMKRAGAALPDDKRARIRAIDDELTKHGQEFVQNINEDTRYVEVTDPKRLAGLPEDWIKAHPATKGVIKISTNYPDYIPLIAYADDDALRKELYLKFKSRGDAQNEAVLAKILTLRAEKAKLLGFVDWADYISDDKMLRGGPAAQKFIDRITGLAKARTKRDYDELLARLKKLDPKATAVGDWQKDYVEAKLKKETYAVDPNEVRAYFPFEQTLAGLLDITSTIYDITYQPVTDPRTWHADVKVYDVLRHGQKLGRIFLDLHPRDDKYKHAAQFTFVDGIAGKQLPEGALVCNFPQPTADSKGLMDHGDVVTMFHEFGHLMHHVLGGQQHWYNQTGVANERDFVEAPSQMFEEWGWSYETLSRFAKHHQTGAVIPKELVEKMLKARKLGIGWKTSQQLFYASVSLAFHRADPAKLDQLATVKKLSAKYVPFAFVEGTKMHTSFGHLEGYSSMYYTYMWSLVIAKDLLTAFEKRGLMSTEDTSRYRDKILAPGGTKPAAELVKDFLGRSYDFKAFEKYLSR